NLNGKMQIIDLQEQVKAETTLFESIPDNDEDWVDCQSSWQLIVHNCTNGGDHSPDESCSDGNVNNGYYEILITTTCTYGSDYYYISPPLNFSGASSSGGLGELPSSNENVIAYLFDLPDDRYYFLVERPEMIKYLENNDAS